EQQFPAAFISEAVDQTRGWFYSLMAESTLLFNKSPYENVIVLGLVLDENGQKMSKSKGNAVDPFEALATYGADAIRWYFYINSAPWLPNRFHGKAVQEGQRKFMGTLWNTYAFFVLYANIDDFDASKYKLEYDKLPVMDKWILSRLNSVIAETDSNLENYRIPEAARALDDFVDELSNWYVRSTRERFWAKGMEQDKINAYMTLYTCLVQIAKAAAPMIPFMAEDIYRNLVCSTDPSAPESVHLCDYPVSDASVIDKELELSMDEVRKLVTIGHAAREEAKIKNRQPIAEMFYQAGKELHGYFADILAGELNVKKVTFVEDTGAFTGYTFKPLLKTLGPKYGKQIGAIKEYLANIDGAEAMATLDAGKNLEFDAGGTAVSIAKEDLLIETAQKGNYVSKTDNGMTVILDTELSDELIKEGYAAEFISKVQNMRKDSGFEVMDHIRISINGNEKISSIVGQFNALMTEKLLADEISSDVTFANTKEWKINDEVVTISIEKV
ncbi:MAG: class I tRNA ligase family protein, partial [Lachnospiraceae bacterium]|nr:class I tRNA ligase family protein [Lachnospiraceae bacterium]